MISVIQLTDVFHSLSGLTRTPVNSLNQLNKLLFCRRFCTCLNVEDNDKAKVIYCQELICEYHLT